MGACSKQWGALFLFNFVSHISHDFLKDHALLHWLTRQSSFQKPDVESCEILLTLSSSYFCPCRKFPVKMKARRKEIGNPISLFLLDVRNTLGKKDKHTCGAIPSHCALCRHH